MKTNPSRHERMLQQLAAYGQLDRQDVDTIAALQKMQADMEQAGYQNQLLQQQVQTAPEITKTKLEEALYNSMGNFAQGMAGLDPGLGSSAMRQLMSKHGMWQQDPMETIQELARRNGVSPEELMKVLPFLLKQQTH